MADLKEFRFGEERVGDEGREFWISILEDEDKTSVTQIKVLSWKYGGTNLIFTIPHAGTIGSDTTAAGDVYCESGNVIRTRIGTNEHPIKTYAKDTATDIIGHQLAQRLSDQNVRPHVIECHVHRSKVECNRSLEEIAVEQRGAEAQEILEVYNHWIQEAIGMCKSISAYVPGVLLLDVHGHGHPHDHIEIGYRLSADLLNQIAEETNERTTWNSVMTSSARHEFTLRHLVRRKFGLEGVEEAVIGEQSFGAALQTAISQVGLLEGIQCIPSRIRPSPGKLGYYIGAHTVREHSKTPGVDCIQIELPLSVRTAEIERRDAVTQVLEIGLLEFYNAHYLPVEGVLPTFVEEDVDPVVESVSSCPPPLGPPGPPPPPCPPPPPAVAKVEGDGISHMTMMAKSRMHAELVTKAKSMQMSRVDPPEPLTATPPPIETPSILNKIKNIEDKNDRRVPRPTNEIKSEPAPPAEYKSTATSKPGETDKPPTKAKPPAKPKLYNSLFADRTLSEKETIRRNFLFGQELAAPPSPEPPQPVDQTDSKPEVEEPEEPAEIQRKSEPKEIVKKKSKCCCTLM